MRNAMQYLSLQAPNVITRMSQRLGQIKVIPFGGYTPTFEYQIAYLESIHLHVSARWHISSSKNLFGVYNKYVWFIGNLYPHILINITMLCRSGQVISIRLKQLIAHFSSLSNCVL